MKLLKQSVAIFVAFGGASLAQADLISADDAVFGADSITIDTSTGLEWLDLNLTQNFDFSDPEGPQSTYSHNDVIARLGAGGEFEGFRLTTEQEVRDLLFSAFGFAEPPEFHTFFSVDQDAAELFVELFGFTMIFANGDPLGTGGRVEVGFGNPLNVGLWDLRLLETGAVLQFTFAGDDSTGGFGTFLVRDGACDADSDSDSDSACVSVPEPGTLALLGIGLAGLGLRRRFSTA